MATTQRTRTTTKKPDKAEVEKGIIKANREIRLLGKTPIERHDHNPLKVAELRTEAYYNICERYLQMPTWEGLALAFGVDRHVLTKWREHQVNWVSDAGISDFLKGEWAFMNSCHVSAMEAGTMDKITGIFLARNNFNYLNEDAKPRQTELTVHFTADQLIEEAKNLQIVDTQKFIDADYTEVKEEKKDKKPKKETKAEKEAREKQFEKEILECFGFDDDELILE